LETTKVVEVHLRAFDPKSKEVVVKEIVFQSNLEQLRSYLSSNGVTLLVNTSQTSGYSADVSSQDLSQQSKSIPIYTTSRGSKRSRYTSSTLGSSIPRESMATILSTSPHKSPGDEGMSYSDFFHGLSLSSVSMLMGKTFVFSKTRNTCAEKIRESTWA